MEEIDLTVFRDDPTYGVVQEQPTSLGSRRPINISTIESTSNSFTQGLNLLRDGNQFIIQHCVELSDLMSDFPSECRYTIKVPRGDTIFFSSETSDSFQRNCFGPGRAFSIKLYDSSQQEVAEFSRRLACGYCTFCLHLQELEVYLPSSEPVGSIVQDRTLVRSSFSVLNRHKEVQFKIQGPQSFWCILSKGENFQILTPDGITQLGSIIYQWDQLNVSYNLLLQMPGGIADTRKKLLLLGAAFLMEYMYYQSYKSKTTCRCLC